MISKIFIDGLRSLNGFEQEFGPGITVVHGPNGCGKTSILESIHLLAQGFSFRARDLKEMIAWNGDELIVRATFEDAGRVTTRAVRVGRRSCEVRENGESLKSVTALFGNLVLKRYRRVLQQRNQWLRQYKREGAATGGDALFAVLTEQLVDLGAKLWAARIELSKEISPIITGYYRKLSGGVDEITCAYKSSILKELDALDGAEFLDDSELDKVAADSSVAYIASDSGECEDGSVDENALREAYRRKLAGLEYAEKIQGITLSGPHKDDLGVCIGESEMRSSGSQGQCRCAAVAMRFAAVDVATRYLSKPILLLDDIFAELDVNRRDAVASLIREKACQVIIATPQLEELPFTAEASIELRI